MPRKVLCTALLFVWGCDQQLEVGTSLTPPRSDGGRTQDGNVAGDGGSERDAGEGHDGAGPSGDGGAAEGDGAAALDLGGRDVGADGGTADVGVRDGSVGGPVFQGSFVLTNQIDLATIAGYAEITGDLSIAAPGMIDISLPNLEVIGGHLTVIDNPDLVTLDLLHLRTVGAELKIYEAPALVTLSLPALERVGESVLIGLTAGLTARTNQALERLELPELREVGGELQIRQNGPTVFQLPVATTGLLHVALPKLRTVGYGLELVDNLRLATFELSSLSSVDERQCLGLGNCLVIHDVAVSGNFSLPECYVTALFNQLRSRGYLGGFGTGYNDDDGVCP